MNWRSLGCMLMLSMMMVACKPSNEPRKITETRTVPPEAANMPSSPPSPGIPAGMPPGMGMPGMGNQPATPTSTYHWAAPEGWEIIPSTPMRKANFKIGADTECYLAVFSGQAGGVQMNVERWRTQMGLGEAPMTPDEIAALPKVPMAGKEGVLAELTGTYVSMKGDSKPNQTLLGAIAEMGNEVVFVKMVGPEATVKTNRDKFLAFCASLQGMAPPPAPVSSPSATQTTPPANTPPSPGK